MGGPSATDREVEIKLRLPDASAGRQMLARYGFVLAKPRVYESNVLYDTAGQGLRNAGRLLRVRRVGETTILTYKGPEESTRHKVREEIELTLSDGPRFATILDRLGMTPLFRYEKYRTEYAPAEGPGLALLDETPIGVFLELEGPADWIDRTARLMGFTTGDYVLASYGALFLESVGDEPRRPAQMVFAESSKISG